MIAAHDVVYRANGPAGPVLLDGVSLDAAPGRVLAVVGPNGAGKSTLLRVLSGELKPSDGDVVMGGKPLETWSLRDRARVRAVLSQSSELTFAFSALDVVLLGRAPHVDRRETLADVAIARLAMSAAGVLALQERAYPTLSGGEKQRVHAARAMAQVWNGPHERALLLDEPTSSLDLAQQHALLAQARRMANDGCAVVCILHDLNLAAQYADEVAVMSRGRLAARGAPADVFTPELLAVVFGVEALVVRHPVLPLPLVVPQGGLS